MSWGELAMKPIYMENKKADTKLGTKEFIELILGAAGALILILLLWYLISPTWDKREEAARSYFNTLEEAIEDADDGGVGRISRWDNLNVYIVYFGHKLRHDRERSNRKMKFIAPNRGNNQVCVCYYAGGKDDDEYEKYNCGFCMELEHEVEKCSWSDDEWIYHDIDSYSWGVDGVLNIEKRIKLVTGEGKDYEEVYYCFNWEDY